MELEEAVEPEEALEPEEAVCSWTQSVIKNIFYLSYYPYEIINCLKKKRHC